MYNKFDRPLCLELKASRILLMLLGVTHLAGLLALVLAPLSLPVFTLLSAILLSHAIYLYRCYISMSMPASIQTLCWSSGQGWGLLNDAREILPVQLREPLFISRYLLVAGFKSGRYRYHKLLVVADSLGPDDFRRLRVRLLECAAGNND